MIKRRIVRVVAALVILLAPLATEDCSSNSGSPGASNPDKGRDTGGGDRAKVQNSFLSKADVTVYYGKASESIKPGGMSDLKRNATKVCLPKGHAGEYRAGLGAIKTMKKGACRSLKDAGNQVANITVK